MDNKYKENYVNLGLNINYYRKKNGITQEKLAQLIGVEKNHIGNIERAKIGASLDTIFSICKSLNISPKDLFDFR